MLRPFCVPASLGLLLGLAGCAHQWMPGPGRTMADMPPVQARCRLAARHGGGGFEAYGKPAAVAAAAVVYGVLEVARTQADFNDCMQANGFLIADGAAVPVQPAMASAPALGTPEPVIAAPLAVPMPDPAAVRAAQAMKAATAWVEAQQVMNHPYDTGTAGSLYRSLCHAGDMSACMMAQAADPHDKLTMRR
jgi:hypothetical protein